MYYEFSFEIAADLNDYLIAVLNNLDFESMWEEENSLKAYIDLPENNSREILAQIHAHQGLEQVKLLAVNLMSDKNWNEEWEANYPPVEVDNAIQILAPFHKVEKKSPYILYIEPRMAFGTGHHATTSQMLREMLNIPFAQKKVLDYGCGSGVLAIMAEKLGARQILAIDIDEWSFLNTQDNIKANDCHHIVPQQGGLESVESLQHFDIILANINRNVILASLESLYEMLSPQGILLVSGILQTDKSKVVQYAESIGFALKNETQQENWQMLRFIKIDK
ncbi:MAG: 50S ribosomal protein L11 methyltransferase [Chitinophagales bacterium]|nr:50S ribosomal protein L11 methyltransferase [Bacteroidota bacterium]